MTELDAIPAAGDPPKPIKLPFKARRSMLRQRIILTFRWWFRLDIDEIKEQNVQAQIGGLVELAQQQAETLQTAIRVLNHMQARLKTYEREIPRMRQLRSKFDQEQERLRMAASDVSQEEKDRLEHGIVGAIGQ